MRRSVPADQRRPLRYLGVFLCGMLAGVALFLLITASLHSVTNFFGVSDLSLEPPERLTEPLALYGEKGEIGELPAGTVLYPQSAYSEGFLVYTLYINFSGTLPSERTEFDRGVTSPVWADVKRPD